MIIGGNSPEEIYIEQRLNVIPVEASRQSLIGLLTAVATKSPEEFSAIKALLDNLEDAWNNIEE